MKYRNATSKFPRKASATFTRPISTPTPSTLALSNNSVYKMTAADILGFTIAAK
jgi:hypothetical protein